MGNLCSKTPGVHDPEQASVGKKDVLSFSDIHNPVRRSKSGKHMLPINDRPNFTKCYVIGSKLGEGSYSVVHLAKQVLPPHAHMDALPDPEPDPASPDEKRFAQPVVPPTASGESAAAPPPALSPQAAAAKKRRDSTYDEGHKFAVKIVDKRKLCRADLKALANEVRILKELRNDHVVHLYECFDEAPLCYLVTELCSGGELFDRVVKKRKYTEACAREAVFQIITGVGFLHSHAVVHRDLKPENVLYETDSEDSKLMIADFGFAKLESSLAEETDVCGTPSYIAPEVLEGKPFNHEVDVWSIGIITFILLAGYAPFHASDVHALFTKIRKCDLRFLPKYWDHVSQDAKDFISKMLTRDPAKRWDTGQLLAHDWLNHAHNTLNDRDISSTLNEMSEWNKVRRASKVGSGRQPASRRNSGQMNYDHSSNGSAGSTPSRGAAADKADKAKAAGNNVDPNDI